MSQTLFENRVSRKFVVYLWLAGLLFSFSNHSFADIEKIVLSAEEKTFIQEHPTITLGSDKSWEPYIIVSPDGNITGYDAEILKKVNQLTGANFTLAVGKWASMQAKAKVHKIDGLSTGTAAPGRTSYLNFSTPYLTLQKSVFVSTGNPQSIKKPEDLQDKTIVIQKGNLADIKLAKQYQNTHILYVDTVEELFSALSTGTADATFGNGATLYLANKLGMPYLHIAFHLPQQLDLVFGIRKDWPLAISIMNKALSTLSQHEKVRIQTRWFSAQPISQVKNIQKGVTLSAYEKYLVEQTPSIRMCVGPNWLPFTFINENKIYQGVTADFMAIISERLSTNFTLVPTSNWSESIALMKEKSCDVITAITPTEARRQFLTFTQPVLTSPIVLATRQDQFFIKDINNIGKKPVAVIKDSSAASLIKPYYPQLNIVEVTSIKEALNKLSEEKVFGYIDSLEVIAHNVNKENHLNIKISSTLPIAFDLAIGVRKDNDWPAWVPIFNKVIESISDEEKRQILNRWVGIQYEKDVDYNFIWSTLAVIAVFIFLGIYRYQVIAGYNKKLEELNQELAKQAMTDQLTQLPNRYLLDKEIQRVTATSKRYGEVFSMVLFDLDYFKEINDEYGHQKGDEVLIHATHEMNQATRDADLLGRWGGEEFLLVCPKTDLQGAIKLAHKVREHLARQRFIADRQITVSAGVAEFHESENYQSMLKRLDDSLYLAKQAGRNTVRYSDIKQ
ncbi:transporter substrate-binding domain-containing protein [Neptunomonas sp.]|uniref:transporter substrate-binding domain-containing diguanylate cyclase n=1 Tax=Neptunomonas sp. TaxID=1971898 RepID=UPI0025DAA360|nr:transporter substrate-binding domain-containing protein [Neptunomonas sp.]